MTNCKVCNKGTEHSSEKYCNGNYCSVQCEAVDYMIDEVCMRYEGDNEVLSSIENFRNDLRTHEEYFKPSVYNVTKNIINQYEEDTNDRKSLKIPEESVNLQRIDERLKASGTSKTLTCRYCSGTYNNIVSLSPVQTSQNTGYCSYCQEYEIIFNVLYAAYSDSNKHQIVLRNIEEYIVKNEKRKVPDSIRFFQLMRDRGIEAGDSEKRAWNIAADECKANVPNYGVVRHSDNIFERGFTKLMRAKF